jgi:hypothetical protein
MFEIQKIKALIQQIDCLRRSLDCRNSLSLVELARAIKSN